MTIFELAPTVCIGLGIVLIIKLSLVQMVTNLTERQAGIGRSACYILMLTAFFELSDYTVTGGIIISILAVVVIASTLPIFEQGEKDREHQFMI